MSEQQQLMQEFKRIDKDNNWLQKNFNKIQTKYGGKFIAIKDGKIIASETSIESLIAVLKGAKQNPDLLLVEFITPKGITIIY